MDILRAIESKDPFPPLFSCTLKRIIKNEEQKSGISDYQLKWLTTLAWKTNVLFFFPLFLSTS